ncbi:hypothetical protein [Flavobacterium covae]|uniref:hypothetical protein n=1 Tax=Flavobacterium covae TaxID=2906076 RepID=UPI000A461647|nr:hypothetical protein [Flavobacterium covae]MCJ1809879.1 hypothetical protein [Flavobacterium covae]
MNPILVKLNISQEEYEIKMMDIYLRWCMDFAINYENDLQKIVHSAPVFNYFKTEFAKCETEFLTMMGAYENAQQIKPVDIWATFYRCIVSLFNRYPKNLIINAKKPITISYDIAAN